jgi:hypothetical protein
LALSGCGKSEPPRVEDTPKSSEPAPPPAPAVATFNARGELLDGSRTLQSPRETAKHLAGLYRTVQASPDPAIRSTVYLNAPRETSYSNLYLNLAAARRAGFTRAAIAGPTEGDPKTVILLKTAGDAKPVEQVRLEQPPKPPAKKRADIDPIKPSDEDLRIPPRFALCVSIKAGRLVVEGKSEIGESLLQLKEVPQFVEKVSADTGEAPFDIHVEPAPNLPLSALVEVLRACAPVKRPVVLVRPEAKEPNPAMENDEIGMDPDLPTNYDVSPIEPIPGAKTAPPGAGAKKK